ncbi:AzlC family ABC transporter permease [bacterium BFN5]|nr:AzlC family ABC transporter permease [bacterium BFN5]
MNMKQAVRLIKPGLIAAIPIVVGYFPVAMAFGLLSKTVELSLLDSCLFSLIVFAGASQFMALDLIKAGISFWDIILATFLLNLRHFMMSASLAVRLKAIRKGWLPFVAFGITDESFAVASLKKGQLSLSYILALQIAAYLAWTAGTFTGYLIGTALPEALQNSLGVGLYAMFTAILVPEIKKSNSVLCLSLLAGTFYLIIDYCSFFPAGWNLIATILLASSIGVYIFDDKTQEEQL